MKPFLDASVAHPSRFGRHRIESSVELADTLARSSGCCSSPSLLLTTNLPCFCAGLLHLWFSRPIPGTIFVLLAIASCFFHYHVDLRLRNSRFWSVTDRCLAYAGMVYHFSVLVMDFFNAWLLGSAAICILSVWFYSSAYSAFEAGNVQKYIWLHSLWHIGAGIGTLGFACK